MADAAQAAPEPETVELSPEAFEALPDEKLRQIAGMALKVLDGREKEARTEAMRKSR